MVFVVQRRCQGHACDRKPERCEPAQRGAAPAIARPRQQQNHQGRHDPQQTHPDQQPSVQQLGRLARISRQDVADHDPVDQHAIGVTEVRGQRSGHQHQGEQRRPERGHHDERQQEQQDGAVGEEPEGQQPQAVSEGEQRPHFKQALPERQTEHQ